MEPIDLVAEIAKVLTYTEGLDEQVRKSVTTLTASEDRLTIQIRQLLDTQIVIKQIVQSPHGIDPEALMVRLTAMDEYYTALGSTQANFASAIAELYSALKTVPWRPPVTVPQTAAA